MRIKREKISKCCCYKNKYKRQKTNLLMPINLTKQSKKKLMGMIEMMDIMRSHLIGLIIIMIKLILKNSRKIICKIFRSICI